MRNLNKIIKILQFDYDNDRKLLKDEIDQLNEIVRNKNGLDSIISEYNNALIKKKSFSGYELALLKNFINHIDDSRIKYGTSVTVRKENLIKDRTLLQGKNRRLEYLKRRCLATKISDAYKNQMRFELD